MREIIFDTETTGLSPGDGDRIIEIGAVEMINKFPTGRTFHEYLHPGDRAIHPDAQRVHGISIEQLKDKPTFKDILPKFHEFFKDGVLIAHNAKFDIGFFDAELKRVGEKPIDGTRVVDTLAIAKRKYPGARNSLDALCDRFSISRASRTLHGALLDSELLADVYIELTGGKQVGMSLEVAVDVAQERANDDVSVTTDIRIRSKPLPSRLTDQEKVAHSELLETIGSSALWNRWNA